MFIRRTTHTDRKTQTQYHTYKLVESKRTPRGPRQSTLLNLGSDFDLPEEQWKDLANRIEEILVGQASLIPCEERLEALAQRFAGKVVRRRGEAAPEGAEGDGVPAADYQSVDLSTLEHERVRPVGAEHAVLETMRELGLEAKFRELGFNGAFVAGALGVVAGRLVAPQSERSTHLWLQEGSGLGELMGTGFEELSQDRVYRSGDMLLRRREELEEHLRGRERDLFGLTEQVVLYDLTNTFLEGSGKYNGKEDRELELTTASHTYDQPGRYTVAVKVIDIFGNDTMTLIPIMVG